MSFAAVQTTFYLKCEQLTWKKISFRNSSFGKKYKKMFQGQESVNTQA